MRNQKTQAELTSMEWVRGETIGSGSFGYVNLAIPRSQSSQISTLMAVKSCGASHSAMLKNEKLILDELTNCPQILRCLGDSYSFENGEKLYNVLLEFASGGALVDKLKNSSQRRLPESDVKRYTKSILKGLHSVHKNGYVHCDIKLQNLLLFSSEDGKKDIVKIADFGLAKKAGAKEGRGCDLRGTPLYMSPEVVTGGEQESPADIWALGCAVAEMVTGAPAWRCRQEGDIGGLLMRIGVGEEVPEIPGNLSGEGQDFLGKCFLKDPRERWTAEMLLKHSFVADHDDDCDTVLLKAKREEVPSTSPRSAFDFPDWASGKSSVTCSITYLPSPEYSSQSGSRFQVAGRLHQLVTDHRPDWSVSDDWVTVR